MLINENLNNTNLAKGGEPIHQIIEPCQKAKNKWGKKHKQTRTTSKHILSNYSGHHMKGSYQKAKNTWGKQYKHTNISKLFWTPHERIISKTENTSEKQQQQKQTQIFKLVWLRAPLSQTSLNMFVLFVCCCCCLCFSRRFCCFCVPAPRCAAALRSAPPLRWSVLRCAALHCAALCPVDETHIFKINVKSLII